MAIKHVKGVGEQQSDFYPFGLTFNSYQREDATPNKIKFQGQEHIDDLDLGWDSFKWRNHMPDIGRFFNVDPLAEKYVYNSPYAFSENHVTPPLAQVFCRCGWHAGHLCFGMLAVFGLPN